jgi:hypothetical protein
MYGFVKKGLLLSLAAGSMVVGSAGLAAAEDSAGAAGATAESPGLGSGNVGQVPADVPVQVCGDTADAAAALEHAVWNDCLSVDNTARIDGAAADDPGAVSGDVLGAAANVPAEGCGLDAAALGAASGADGNTCAELRSSASAEGATHDDAGAVSGDVVQASVNAPVELCGDSVSALGFADNADRNTCTIG